MKKTIVWALLALNGCGFGARISEQCGGSLVDLCHGIFGETDAQEQLRTDVDNLKQRQDWLEQALANVQADAQGLQAQYNVLQSTVHAQQAALAVLEQALIDAQAANSSSIAGLQAQIDALNVVQQSTVSAVQAVQDSLNLLQVQSNSMLTQLATLQGYTHIYAVVDPCGDGPGFDEVLLRTSAGWLAYFESGATRHLALLPAGAYQTTDGQHCHFSISAAGALNY